MPICASITDFTNEDFCSTSVQYQTGGTVDGNSSFAATSVLSVTTTIATTNVDGCMSPNVCERGSSPRAGDPCVCNMLTPGQCNYLCVGIHLHGSSRSVVEEGRCPLVCDDAEGYESRPRQLWLMVLCISALGPLLVTALLGVLRPTTTTGLPSAPPPLNFKAEMVSGFRRCAKRVMLRVGAGGEQPQPQAAAVSPGGVYTRLSRSEGEAGE